MKCIIASVFLMSSWFCSASELISPVTEQDSTSTLQRNRLSIYFGWNRAAYSASDIRFYGADYDFTIMDAAASDRQTEFSFEKYFAIESITIPQTNMGLSYQLTEKVSLAFNVDHMKYVLDQDQKANIDGTIGYNYPNWAGDYDNESAIISEDLVRFEHTDGLNYVNFSYTRNNLLGKRKRIVSAQLNYGGSLGFMLPKTNSRLLGNERYDDFNVAGYGVGIYGGAQINIGSVFFLATNLKGGFINMPNIKTTLQSTDHASQHFSYVQVNGLFGLRFNLDRLKKPTELY